MQKYKFEVKKEESGQRIDKFLAKKINDFSRSYIQTLIENKDVKVNNAEIQNSYKIKNKDIIELNVEEKESEIKAVELPLDIIYEDNDIIVINKNSDRVVHPAPGHHDDT
ncbi:MAG: S4 domain-containing protein, partial [Halanaerobium sp.]